MQWVPINNVIVQGCFWRLFKTFTLLTADPSGSEGTKIFYCDHDL